MPKRLVRIPAEVALNNYQTPRTFRQRCSVPKEYVTMGLRYTPRTLHGPFDLRDAEFSHCSAFWTNIALYQLRVEIRSEETSAYQHIKEVTYHVN